MCIENENLSYEYFIRRCWDCSRFKHGADTDLWDSLMGKEYDYLLAKKDYEAKQIEFRRNNLLKKEQIFESQFCKIKGYIQIAFEKVISSNKAKGNNDVYTKLLDLKNKSNEATTPKELITIIKEAFPLLNSIKC